MNGVKIAAASPPADRGVETHLKELQGTEAPYWGRLQLRRGFELSRVAMS